MTPTTPRQAREAAELYRDTGTTVSVKMVFSLADQVEALTKERDALAAEVVRLDAGWHDANGDTLDKALELDKVKAAAKLALDALSNHGFPYLGHTAEYEKAEAALRQAGVQ